MLVTFTKLGVQRTSLVPTKLNYFYVHFGTACVQVIGSPGVLYQVAWLSGLQLLVMKVLRRVHLEYFIWYEHAGWVNTILQYFLTSFLSLLTIVYNTEGCISYQTCCLCLILYFVSELFWDLSAGASRERNEWGVYLCGVYRRSCATKLPKFQFREIAWNPLKRILLVNYSIIK